LRKINLIQTATSDYRVIWALQNRLFEEVVVARNINYLILTEHTPVITVGKSGTLANLLVDPADLEANEIELIYIDRGGDITFHGPGQLVGYPILDLTQFKEDVGWYLRTLEEVIIRTLDYFDIAGTRIKGLTGVWVGNNKICAIGIKTRNWVTMHGFALNISTDLDYFRYIVPCGISGKGVTSISAELGNNIAEKDVVNILCTNFIKYFKGTLDESIHPAVQDLQKI
jgi:lipoyl(octanoyl) transferase